MRTLTYTRARQNLAATMDEVIEDHSSIVITRGSDKAVVMMSLEDWNAWQETLYLLRSPANAKRLLDAARDFDSGENLVVQDVSD